jgi:hypothetical protein
MTTVVPVKPSSEHWAAARDIYEMMPRNPHRDLLEHHEKQIERIAVYLAGREKPAGSRLGPVVEKWTSSG